MCHGATPQMARQGALAPHAQSKRPSVCHDALRRRARGVCGLEKHQTHPRRARGRDNGRISAGTQGGTNVTREERDRLAGGMRSSATADVDARLQQAHSAQPRPSGRSTKCMREARRFRPGP